MAGDTPLGATTTSRSAAGFSGASRAAVPAGDGTATRGALPGSGDLHRLAVGWG